MLAKWIGLMFMGAALPIAEALVYWPISTPSDTSPWVVGQPNAVTWATGGGTGVDIFDIQLHNLNKSVMIGFLELAQRVPMRTFSSGTLKGIYGGELAIDLVDNAPTGDGFSLVFLDTQHGQVYAKSNRFSIYPAAQAPSNYTTATLPAGTPETTVTITDKPNPTQQYIITLDGVVPVTTTSAQTIVGNAGSGT